jgi:hypothetical protein
MDDVPPGGEAELVQEGLHGPRLDFGDGDLLPEVLQMRVCFF